MDQQELFIDDVWEAMKVAARAITVAQGHNAKAWTKVVGHMLFPHKEPNDAGRYLSNCLDPNRNEKLDVEQFLLLNREARKSGCHVLMAFICDDCGYQRTGPTKPKDEYAELQRQYINAAESIVSLSNEMKRVLSEVQEESFMRTVK